MLDYFPCPHCGADVPIQAKSCPECGSDKETGWSEEARYLHLLPNIGEVEGDAKLSFIWKKEWISAIAGIVLVSFLTMQAGMTGLYVLIAGGLLGAAGYFLYRRLRRRKEPMERQLYQQLLRRAGGDRKKAERLIDYEHKLYPDSSRTQQLQNAIYHWDRDRH